MAESMERQETELQSIFLDPEYFEVSIINNDVDAFYNYSIYWKRNESDYQWYKWFFLSMISDIINTSNEESLFNKNWLFLRKYFEKLYWKMDRGETDLNNIFENEQDRSQFFSLSKEYLFGNHWDTMSKIRETAPSQKYLDWLKQDQQRRNNIKTEWDLEQQRSQQEAEKLAEEWANSWEE